MRTAILVLGLASACAAGDRLDVAIAGDGTLSFGGEAVEAVEVKARLKAAVEAGPKEGPVSGLVVDVACDAQAPAGAFLDFILAGAEAGIWQYMFRVDKRSVEVLLPRDGPLEDAGEIFFPEGDEDPVGIPGEERIRLSTGVKRLRWEEEVRAARERKTGEKSWISMEKFEAREATAENLKALAVEVDRRIQARRGEGGKASVIVECAPDVSAGHLHALLCAFEDAAVLRPELAVLPK